MAGRSLVVRAMRTGHVVQKYVNLFTSQGNVWNKNGNAEETHIKRIPFLASG